MRIIIRLLVALSVMYPLVRPSHAQIRPPPPPPPPQVFISALGSDQNPCTQANPCRSVGRALVVVASGGQVWILDSGDFNGSSTVNITMPVSIQAVPGVIANLSASFGTPAVQVNAPGATVALRNLTFTDQGTSPGTGGLVISAAGVVSVENCLFADLRMDALSAVNTNAVVHVSNTTFRNVNGWAVAAVNGPTMDVSNSRMLHTEGAYAGNGTAGTTSTLSITDSTISDGKEGVFASSTNAAAPAQIFVTRSTIFGTTYALDSESGGVGTALITVANSSITNNQVAFFADGRSVVKSLGNNYIADNAAEQGTLTTTPLR